MTSSYLSYASRAACSQTQLAKHLLQLMDTKQTNLALSADVTEARTLLALADLLGPEICLLKTHIDILTDFSPALTKALRKLADTHHFLLFEDRKFADIGNTVKHQYAGGIYRIADWADLINAHSLPGPGMVQGLADVGLHQARGLLLIAEMSSAGQLMDRHYVENTLKMAEKHANFVLGFITQHALTDDPQWINFTPGIQIKSGGDKLGQQYITPEEAILTRGTDVLIVGRGITEAADPLTEARHYRTKGWEAYQKKLKTATQQY